MNISGFFDEMSKDRDKAIRNDAVLKYEQDMRQRAVFDLLQPNRSDWILDIGCGNARDLRILMGAGYENIVGIDLSFGMLLEGKKILSENSEKKSMLFAGDATQIPLREGFFDKIICSEVIEHIPDYHRVLEEIYRLLVPGGKLIVTTPNLHSMYGVSRKFRDLVFPLIDKGDWRSSHPYDKWKTRTEVKTALRECGFKVENEVGVCYLPGLFSYRMPTKIKRGLVQLVGRIEDIARAYGFGGYMMAIASYRE
jgi:ubiquinone/menaquinone biosynthesis C-methylase UbiE